MITQACNGKEISKTIYDIVVVGGGPSGLASAIYASRYGLKTILFSDSFGGAMGLAHIISNYPGFKEISGLELADKFIEQAKAFGAEIEFEKVIDIAKNGDCFIVNTDRRTVNTRKVILAIGRTKKKLGIEREDELIGKGISYCATCDSWLYKGKVVGVVGGSDSAVTSALLLADLAKKVYLLYRKDRLRAEDVWVKQALSNPKIEVLYNTEITELLGTGQLTGIRTNASKMIQLDGLFIEIGMVPNTELLAKLGIALDSENYIVVDKSQKTSIPSIFAVGDATNSTELKQVLTSASQGAIAVYHCHLELKSHV